MDLPRFRAAAPRPLFLCIISNTDTGKIPGLSAAGTTPELTDYTPGADAELVETNRIITMPELPEAPGGSPTPAIVTKAALNLTGIPSLFVASGLRKKPAVPYAELGGAAGSDIRKETGCAGCPRSVRKCRPPGKEAGQALRLRLHRRVHRRRHDHGSCRPLGSGL